MQHRKYNEIDDDTLNKVISAAYDDAGLKDRIMIYFLTKRNPQVKQLFNEYRNTSKKVKRIPLDKCPSSVTESLNITVAKENKALVIKPAYVFPVIILLVSILITILITQTKEEKKTFTKAEIELAEQQVKKSLTIVNKVFKKTENLIHEEVLPKRVGKPIQKSLSIINEVLIGG